MSWTQQEKPLIHRLPMQWRSLLSPLFHKSLQGNTFSSMVAMNCRQHAPQSKESWDELLTSFSRLEPAIDKEGNLSFQRLLWCFPEHFIEGVLELLLRFHDIVSADSLDAFLHSTLSENRSTLTCSVQEKLAAILAFRNGKSSEKSCTRCLGNESILGKKETVHAHRTETSMDCKDMSDRIKVDGGDRYSKVQCEKTCPAVGTTTGSSEFLGHESHINILTKSSLFDFGQEINDSTLKNRVDPLKCNNVTNADELVLILDSEEEIIFDTDEEDKSDIGLKKETAVHSVQKVDDSSKALSQVETLPEMAISTVESDESDKADYQGAVEKLQEALSSETDVVVDLDFLATLSPTQMYKVWDVVDLSSIKEASMSALFRQLASMSDKLSHASSTSLIDTIVKQKYMSLEETPSRHMMSCLKDLATSFPKQLAFVLSDCLQNTPCTEVQADIVCSLSRLWDADTLTYFLGVLCQRHVHLNENLLTVIQCAISSKPLDLNPNLLDSILRLLETGTTSLAKSARYGRLILNFIKSYKSQMNSTHSAVLQNIAEIHTSVVRKSLRSAVSTLS